MMLHTIIDKNRVHASSLSPHQNQKKEEKKYQNLWGRKDHLVVCARLTFHLSQNTYIPAIPIS